jgi:hypothetical protein
MLSVCHTKEKLVPLISWFKNAKGATKTGVYCKEKSPP